MEKVNLLSSRVYFVSIFSTRNFFPSTFTHNSNESPVSRYDTPIVAQTQALTERSCAENKFIRGVIKKIAILAWGVSHESIREF